MIYNNIHTVICHRSIHCIIKQVPPFNHEKITYRVKNKEKRGQTRKDKEIITGTL